MGKLRSNQNRVAVQFGAGNIGRGFMGHLFWEAGYRTIFVDVNKELVNSLNASGKYPLRILDTYLQQEYSFVIERIEALSTEEVKAVSKAIAGAEIMGTAVGVKNLESIAPLIAAGIVERHKRGGNPVDVYLCENIQNAASILKETVFRILPPDLKGWAEANIGFVGTIVSRMVPPPHNRPGMDDPLLVFADSYRLFPYDAMAIRSEPPPIEGMKPVKNFQAEVEQKLFTYNLVHAALSYLGYLKGYSYIHEPLHDDSLSSIVLGALDESQEALSRKYPDELDPGDRVVIRRDIIQRFGCPAVMDTVTRVGREPLRKLRPGDRLVGSAMLCLSQGIFPSNIAVVCAAALCYDFQGDPEAVQLQKMIREGGIEDILKNISGVEPESELGKRIIESYLGLKRFYGKGN
ncbi:MAG: mannitol-1-phosphate 5-dehydrogenase [Spirochaetota bacterium]